MQPNRRINEGMLFKTENTQEEIEAEEAKVEECIQSEERPQNPYLEETLLEVEESSNPSQMILEPKIRNKFTKIQKIPMKE